MSFIKLFPHKNQVWLPLTEVIDRMRTEFRHVNADPDAGQDHVGDMIAATLRFSDELPNKKELLADLLSVRDSAIYVVFGDDGGNIAHCCLMKDRPLFFGLNAANEVKLTSLVKRLADVLNYKTDEA